MGDADGQKVDETNPCLEVGSAPDFPLLGCPAPEVFLFRGGQKIGQFSVGPSGLRRPRAEDGNLICRQLGVEELVVGLETIRSAGLLVILPVSISSSSNAPNGRTDRGSGTRLTGLVTNDATDQRPRCRPHTRAASGFGTCVASAKQQSRGKADRTKSKGIQSGFHGVRNGWLNTLCGVGSIAFKGAQTHVRSGGSMENTLGIARCPQPKRT